MNTNRKFLIDANPFIEAKNRYYGFDFCPGFWHVITDLHEERIVASIDRVKTELLDQNDVLSNWVKETAPAEFFKKTEAQSVIEKYRELMRWVYAQSQFRDSAKAEFAAGADGWLIAYASVNKYVVVTHEQLASDAKKKVQIPNVANVFGVECRDTFEMLREAKARLIRSTKKM